MGFSIFSRKRQVRKGWLSPAVESWQMPQLVCSAYVQGVRQGEAGLWVDIALVPVAGAWVCQEWPCIMPGSRQHFPSSSTYSSDGKSSPGSEFPGLEPQQRTSCWIPPASLAGKHTGGGGGDPGSCCPPVTPRVQSVGQQDFTEKTVSA